MKLSQFPHPGQALLHHSGDTIAFTLEIDGASGGRAILRTSLGGAKLMRREIIESMDSDRPPLAVDWSDFPMEPIASDNGKMTFSIRVPLIDIGSFRAKCCYFPKGSDVAIWPEGEDVCIKVEPAWTCCWSSIYCAFPRQFGTDVSSESARPDSEAVKRLDREQYTVIPQGGTFRSFIRHLDTILLEERFRIVQLLPVHPCPTTFARMGRYGSPFAGTDFLTVDSGLAEFDPSATPMDQFHELVDAVHTRGARIFIDLPANHTGWASALQTHHPEWFRKDGNRFHSPGAWGIVWEDLVELDYAKPGLRDFMAGVFEFWCAQGVDGFRCDAGYMIPADTWHYIVARVREQFPDTVFLLEGLGGKISVTRDLIANQGLDWAYSEIFQTEDRSAFEHYLPGAQEMSESVGPLAHYAETHDNNRLAARSPTYARMRTSLAALASAQGCFGITNGVEWFATEKVDVHRASALRWGAPDNQVRLIRRLNTILATLPAWGAGTRVRMVQHGAGNVLALLRTPTSASRDAALVLVNLDSDNRQPVSWNTPELNALAPVCIFDSANRDGAPSDETTPSRFSAPLLLRPGQVLCCVFNPAAPQTLQTALDADSGAAFLPETVRRQELRMAVLRIRRILTNCRPLSRDENVDELAEMLARDPLSVVRRYLRSPQTMPPVTTCSFPDDTKRIVPLPSGNLLLVRAPSPFRARLVYTDEASGRHIRKSAIAFRLNDGTAAAFIDHPSGKAKQVFTATLNLEISEPGRPRRESIALQVLPRTCPVRNRFTGMEVLRNNFAALLTNGTGAMSHVRARWPEVDSQYDAILAANPDPNVPCDRQVLFTRCRAWIVNNGFSSELNTFCLHAFEATRESVQWIFQVPVGTGRFVSIETTLRLEKGRNRARLAFRRLSADGQSNALENAEPVRIILRPDVESRSFHTKTKAFAGPEQSFPRSVQASAAGFTFSPPNAVPLQMEAATFALRKNARKELPNAASFAHESEWHYMVPNPAEAKRGQDGNNDLFSPGWFSSLLSGDEELCLTAEIPNETAAANLPVLPPFETPIQTLSGALKGALRDFIVRRDANATVIAGYPWFLDWGRDTFIVLRGMIADGLYDAAQSIIRTFGAFEQNGTLPNMICGNDASNRDTSDAQLWYCTAVSDLCNKIGRDAVLSMVCTPSQKTVRTVLVSIAEGYRRGTPNGIRMDEKSGLIYSPTHFTWMDTNFPAGTPRQGYPIEIQALWIHTLAFVASIDPKGPWQKLADLARTSLLRYFRIPGRSFLSDCLHANEFCPAEYAAPDDHLRCNQLFAVTLGAVTDPETIHGILESSESLLVPGAIRTLSPQPIKFALPIYGQGGLLNDPNRPYWGRYEGDEDTRRKPAYHNGTAWSWPFPSYAEALYLTYGESALEAAQSLIASAAPWLSSDCIGHLPEIADGDAPHIGGGCDAQAWSASEFLRVAHLLGLCKEE